MKTIKIKFVDFWPAFRLEDDFVYRALKNSGKYQVEISDKPDYIVYSGFGFEHLKYNGIKIFYTGEQETPDFNICDYAIGFDYMDFGDRYFRMPFYYHKGYENDYDLMRQKHLQPWQSRDKFCSFVYSNQNADSSREIFFHLLSEYKKVDSGGAICNNIGEKVKDKLAFEREHKFSIAFENIQYPGYVTEKIVQSFAAGCVPVYWGDPRITDEFNPKSFISVMDFPCFEEAVSYILKVDADDELYRSYLKQPAIIEENRKERITRELYSFIEHIFAQPIETAKRVSGGYWNKRYCNQRKTLGTAYGGMQKLSKPLRSIYKHLR